MGKNPGKGITMGKIAFLSNNRLKNMEFAETVRSLKAQGHELIRVVPEYVGTSGEKNKKGFGGPRKNLEKPAAEKFDALLIFQRYSLNQLKTNKELVEFVADFLESGKPVWTGNPDRDLLNSPSVIGRLSCKPSCRPQAEPSE